MARACSASYTEKYKYVVALKLDPCKFKNIKPVHPSGSQKYHPVHEDDDRPYLFYSGRELNSDFNFATSNQIIPPPGDMGTHDGWVYETTLLEKIPPAVAIELRMVNPPCTYSPEYARGSENWLCEECQYSNYLFQ